MEIVYYSFEVLTLFASFCQKLKVLVLTFVNKNDEDCSLDIFEIVASTKESMKGIVK